MIIMPIPKDVRKIKSKVFLHFTIRNLQWLGAGFILPVIMKSGLALLSDDEIFLETVDYLSILIFIVCGICGFVDIQDMPAHIYAREILINKYFGHKKRPYRTENIYEPYAVQNKITYEYFDDVDDTVDKKGRKLPEKKIKKIHEKRLKKFLKENPDLRPID